MNIEQCRNFVEGTWESSIIPALHDYIRIPNQSPAFDPDWEAHGYMAQAVQLAKDWVESRNLRDSKLEVLQIPGRTPLLLLEVEGQKPGTVLLYGHLDKQPPFEGWRTEEGLGPWTPVMRDGKLYGRGGADDGYAIFASVTAIEALQRQNVPHPRLVVAIECSEESGSPDLPAYMEAYADRVGAPDLVVCLDSGCGDYDRVWSTTSLRGIVAGFLHVKVLREGVHSGDASGIVPSSFRIARQLLARLEDIQTGEIHAEGFNVEIPKERIEQAAIAAQVLGDAVAGKFPYVEGMGPVSRDTATLILNRTWRPALSVTGAAGFPEIETAGNVLRPSTSLKLSLRVPPSLDADVATARLKELFETDPPYGAQVSFELEHPATGWEAPPTAKWLQESVNAASMNWFDNPSAAMGEGGSIPFMGMLGKKFPKAQFLVTGVLGPESNAHGPNEFLHLRCATNLTGSVAQIIANMG
jgi:acetylornithine deacetylase/succinyl-diaminopimelate desuccinylase-like protein